MRGNAYTTTAAALSSAVVRVGGQGGDNSLIGSCLLDIVLESNPGPGGGGAGASAPASVLFGGASNKIADCVGVLAFRDAPWQKTNATQASDQIQFHGICYSNDGNPPTSSLVQAVNPPVSWV
jgi:hypothetical protein